MKCSNETKNQRLTLTKTEKEKFASVEELKKQSQTWNLSEWDNYLKDFEVPLKETLLPPQKYQDLAETNDMSEYFRSGFYSENYQLSKELKQAKKFLSEKERKVIHLFFHQDLTNSEVAKKLKISKQSALIQKNRALEKIRKYLLSKKAFFLNN